ETTHSGMTEPPPLASEPVPVVTAPSIPEMHPAEPPAEQAFAAAAPIPSFEYQPPVQAVASAPIPSTETAYGHVAVPEVPATPASHSMSVDHATVTASVEAAIPEAAAAVAADAAGEHHHTIAQAVHRVMERLKPELVEEIMKELKAKR